MRTSTFLLILSLLTFGCGTTPRYEYADGNGNLYTISSTMLAYVPVKPEESSSGTYNGGEPKTVQLTLEQFRSLRTLLERAIMNKAIHTNDRVKMSGAISEIDGNERQEYILQPGTAELAAIEGLLREILAQ